MGLDMYLRTNSRTLVKKLEKMGLVDESRARGGIVMYWRKANAIHGWLVDHVQNGEDDCKEYEVRADQLHELAQTCRAVLASTKIVEGPVQRGSVDSIGDHTVFVDAPLAGTTPVIETGRVLEDITMARALLPTREGFFFGSSEYGDDYISDLESTAEGLEAILALITNDGSDFKWHWYVPEEPDWKVRFTYRSS